MDRHQNDQISLNLATLVLLSVLGGISSTVVGYTGTLLSGVLGGNPISGQVLSGLHVFWLVLSATILKRNGAAMATGALKGLIEMLLLSHLGIFVFLISFVEGLVVDAVLFLFKRTSYFSLCLASGFSAASNVFILQLFLIRNLPFLAYLGIYLVSFLSGLILGGFLAGSVLKSLRTFLPKTETPRKGEQNQLVNVQQVWS